MYFILFDHRQKLLRSCTQLISKKRPNSIPLLLPVHNGGHIVNTPVKSADGRFFGGFLKGIEMAYGQAEFFFGAIGEGKVLAEKVGQHDGGRRGDDACLLYTSDAADDL